MASRLPKVNLAAKVYDVPEFILPVVLKKFRLHPRAAQWVSVLSLTSSRPEAQPINTRRPSGLSPKESNWKSGGANRVLKAFLGPKVNALNCFLSGKVWVGEGSSSIKAGGVWHSPDQAPGKRDRRMTLSRLSSLQSGDSHSPCAEAVRQTALTASAPPDLAGVGFA